MDLTTISGSPWYLTFGILILLIVMFKRLKMERLLFAGIVSSMIFVMIALLFWGINYEILIPISLLVALWSFFSLMVPSRKREPRGRLLVSLTLFVSPIIYGLLMAMGMGVSIRLKWMILEGIALMCASYGMICIMTTELIKRVSQLKMQNDSKDN